MAVSFRRFFISNLNSLARKQCVYSNWKISTSKCMSSLPDIKADDIKFTKCETPRPKPTNIGSIEFGTAFTDHMLTVKFSKQNGWDAPEIVPYGNISIDPAAKVLHYSLETGTEGNSTFCGPETTKMSVVGRPQNITSVCQTLQNQGFEGMKAYKAIDGSIRLFRPMENMKRLQRTSERLCLPEFNGEEFLKCLMELIKLDKDWVPSEENCSLYVRPTIIGTMPTLGVNVSDEALLYCILSPVGPYFKTGSFNPVTLMADPKFVRSWHGGSGNSKAGGNYGPTILAQVEAMKKNCEQVLWLYGEDEQLTEVGTMNIFIFWENENGEEELVTPPLDGLILPGITRMSLLDLAREWNEFKVSEKRFTMSQLLEGLKENRIKEVFGAGTACVICPIKSILRDNQIIDIPTMENGPKIAKKFYDELTGIQYGRIPSPWSVVVTN